MLGAATDRGHAREAGDSHKNSKQSELEEDIQDTMQVSEIAGIMDTAIEKVR